MNLSAGIYGRLAGDGELAALLATYDGEPAIFTSDPAPGDAVLPYIVTAGAVSDVPFDTKDHIGRQVMRDVRCYAAANGSTAVVEQIAERVRVLLHRQPLEVDGEGWLMSNCTGPIAMDDLEAYGRVVTLMVTYI